MGKLSARTVDEKNLTVPKLKEKLKECHNPNPGAIITRFHGIQRTSKDQVYNVEGANDLHEKIGNTLTTAKNQIM